ncbi:hypothetical protein AUEXF2481DRAFT_62886 [Aureobasidium subglaciale EXF-2481]|uniref:Peptidase M3A/M3B catalytic domain-containing protein n=1 Tax=Aureobasidium subglaciale (strain EXF-2481) TaxID=1043005 RepID=A0A074YUR6_AURSE|nr:uncharacterized protein AUEXF2481DRAFT_62886 [Aureobasidium subglaciale EXF-2481]KAI5204327.1 metallopeptidase MepB [Aureobasidium subglaciale]KEQ97887.1 hypothetical protein AUEXF2481DRAFT_62886 [Aureobasidium subglaciale EXF-2481]
MSQIKIRSPPQLPPVFTKDASTIAPELEALVEESRSIQKAILASITPETATFANVVLPLARSQNLTSRIVPVLCFYEAVSSDKSLRDVSTTASTMFADFEIETKADQRVFDLIDAVVKKNEVLGAEDQRLLNRYHKDFVRNGLGVSLEQRDRFKDIQKALHQLTSEFQKNLREGSKGIWFVPEALAGVPEDMISTLTRGKDDEEGKVLLTFSSPHMSTIMSYAMNSETRRDYFIASENKCLQNVSVFKQIMILRQEAAQILEYTNHAAFRIEDKMAKTPKAVMSFLDDLHSRLSEGAKSDVEGLKGLKRKDQEARADDRKMYLWDWAYYNRLMLETQHSVNRQEIAEYFPLQTTVAGVMDIYSRLFGLVFEEVCVEDRDAFSPTDQGSDLVWQEDVRLFAVWDDEEEGGSFLGYLYLDLFPRAGKYGGMCNMNLQCGFEKQDGSRHYPATALICNFTKPTATKPSLLTHDEVQLFFHELGHGIHDLVAKTKFSVFHGTATVDDFCEAPSQMLEFWCWVPQLLQELSCHYSYLSAQHLSTWQEENSGVEQPTKHIPLDTIEKLTKSKIVNGSLFQTRLLHRSYFDMIVHQPSSLQAIEDMDIAAEWNKLNKISFLDTPEGSDWGHEYANFDALVRVYDAGFYGYLYARAYATDMFYSVFKDDPLNKVQGRRYRRTMLEKGGSVDEMETLVEFLGREPSTEAFYKELELS